MQPGDESSLIKSDRSAPALRAVPPETRLAAHISATTLNLLKRYSSEILPTEHSVEVLPDYCEVESITYSPDGRYLALGCPSNHQIRILETVNYTVFSVIKLSDHYFNTLDFSPNSKELAFDMQGAIWIWDIENGRHTKTLNCNCEYISEIKYSPAGQFIAAIVKGDIIQIWDTENVTCTAEIAIHSETHIEGCHERMIISPDGRILALSDSGGDVHLWSTITGKFLKVMQIPSSFMCFSPDSKYIAGCNANIITIWNIKTDRCVKRFEEQTVNTSAISYLSQFKILAEHHTHRIAALTYLQNGKTVASASNDKTIRLWNIRTGKCSITNLTKDHIVDQGVFSPDFKYLAAGHLSSIQVINIDTGRIYKTLNKYRLGIQSAAFSGDSKTLFLAQSYGVVELWNFEECKCISVSKIHDCILYPTKPHKDNSNFTFISTKGDIITWNTQSHIVVKNQP